MKTSNFKLGKKPIVGPAPMDGITDLPFREIVDIYGHPDLLFTEFVSADAIEKGAIKTLYGLFKHKTKIPIIAQIFGCNPKTLYKAAVVVAYLGFDGIDINMGCPDRKVISRGGGAALIKTPRLAQECIKSVKQAVKDWSTGITLEKANIHANIINNITNNVIVQSIELLKLRDSIPVSVKTRIGYDSIITEQWIENLLEAKPNMISLHGRTLKQMYHGKAHWEEIGKAAKICHRARVKILGNGDIKSVQQGNEYCWEYSTDGYLIGRAALGNPWVFANHIPTLKERINVMKHHCRLFLKFRPDLQLMPMRKHLAWYCKGFNGAAEIRNKLIKVTTMEDLNSIISLCQNESP